MEGGTTRNHTHVWSDDVVHKFEGTEATVEALKEAGIVDEQGGTSEDRLSARGFQCRVRPCIPHMHTHVHTRTHSH